MKRKISYRWILYILLCCFSPEPGHTKSLKLPNIPLSEAIRLAEAHLQKENIDVSNHYLAGAQWVGSQNEYQEPYWHLVWKIQAYMALGGEVFVYIDKDGKTRHAYGE